MTDITTPFFTVIIPTYNRPALLAEAVESVVRQSCPDWKLIIIDDASPIPAQAPDDSRIRLIRNGVNRGAAASFNTAISLARGRVIAFLADDDAWVPERLENARVAHEGGADVVVCGTSLLGAGETLVPKKPIPPKIHSMCATSITKVLCPPLDESLRAVEDIEWAVRVDQNQPVIKAVQSPDFLWRVHTGERHLNGIPARIFGHRQLLEKQSEYYAAHSAERAERLHHVGLLYYKYGKRGRALRFALASLRVRPSTGAAELVLRVGLPQAVSWAALRSSMARKAPRGPAGPKSGGQ